MKHLYIYMAHYHFIKVNRNNTIICFKYFKLRYNYNRMYMYMYSNSDIVNNRLNILYIGIVYAYHSVTFKYINIFWNYN